MSAILADQWLLVESLCKDIEGLKCEADRLRKLLEEKKRNKPGRADGQKKDYSSDKRRTPDKPSPPLLRNHRSRKELEIHETTHCPVDKVIA